MSKTLKQKESIIKKIYVDFNSLGISEKLDILVYSNTLSPFLSYLEIGLFGFLVSGYRKLLLSIYKVPRDIVSNE